MPGARHAYGVSLEQLRAMDLSRLVFLSAAAGSGKTRVLVARFLWALEQVGGNLDAVAAITFTEKAAAELLERVRTKCAAWPRSAAASSGQTRSRACRARASPPSMVSVHACPGEHVLEPPIDPDFEQADAATFSILADDAIATTLEALGREPVDGAGAVLFRALGEVTSRSLREHLRRLHERRDLARPWARHMTDPTAGVAPSPAELVRQMELLHQRADETERWLVQPLARHAALGPLQDVVAHLPLPANARRFAPAVQRVKHALERRGTAAGDDELLDALCDLDSLPPPRSWDADAAQRLQAAMRPIRPLLPRWRAAVAEADELDQRRARYLRDLAHMFLISLEQLERHKASGRLLDFQDLQEKTLELLQREATRASVQARLQHLLVDEFQDTDPLQWEIVLHLFGDGRRLDRSGLCLVGDEKQSIYAFRSAEVALCKRARDAILEANQRLELLAREPILPEPDVELGEAEARGFFELRETYRFLPGLARFHNDLFSHLFASEPKRDYEARFAPMRAVGERLAMPREARIELVLAPAEAQGPELVARRIARLLAERPMVYDKAKRTDRALVPGDVAVLLRSRRPLNEIEKCLAREGVPYLVSGGLGYFSRPEVTDLLNLLRFATRPNDSVALLGLLRSPFLALDDTSVYGVARAGTGPLWHRLQRWHESGGTLLDALRSAEVRRAFHWLSESMERSAWMAPADWLRHCCERSGFLVALAASARAQSDLLNAEKFFDLVRALGMRGLSLFEIAAWLGKHVDENLLEGEAEPEEATANLVKVMTVHAAKGLEFPVVVVPDLGITPPTGSGDGLTLLGTRDAPLVSAKLVDDGDLHRKKLGTRYLIEREKRTASSPRSVAFSMLRSRARRSASSCRASRRSIATACKR
ncbi:MAG: UvrD-helicase domain-containing protein [Planctomycetota bacterium]